MKTHLSDGQVAEPADELLLVERIRRHLHPAHGVHGLVHPEELILGHLDLERGRLGAVRMERVVVELDREGRRVRCVVRERRRVGRGLQRTDAERLERKRRINNSN